MIAALLRSILQLTDPPIRRVIWISVLATVGAFVILAFGVSGLLYALHVTGIGWLDKAVGALGGIAELGLAYLLFPAVVPAVSSLFLDDVAAAVERRHYPLAGPARSAPLAELLVGTLRFLAVSIALNLLALPLYLVPGMNLAVFLGLNGYLLGREYYEQVAERRLDLPALKALRRRHRLRLFVAGVVICGLAALPLVNLLAPVIACAFMVHLFQRLPGRA